MLSQSTTTKTKDEVLFETYYRLIKQRDEKELSKLVAGGACLDFFHGEYNLVMLLAKEGDVESVNFLISKFKASRNHAVLGYARGGHIAEVDEQIEQGACRDYAVVGYARECNEDQVEKQIALGASRDYAAQGYALGGHVEQANEQIKKGARRNDATLGYARACNIEQVNEQIAQGASRNPAALGYAHGGHVDQVKEQILKGADPSYAAQGYALLNLVDRVNELVAQGASRNNVVAGYARSGNVEQVNIQIAAGASRDYAVLGYARGGFVDQVNEQIAKGASRDYAVMGYANGYHIDQVNEQIAKGASQKKAVHGYVEGGHLNQLNLLHLMSLTDNADVRQLLAEEVNKQAKDIAIRPLLTKARKLNQLVRQENLTYTPAQGYLTAAANDWLFQGQNLVTQNGIPVDIYFHILSFIVGTSGNNARKIFHAANHRLHTRVMNTPSSWFKSKVDLEKEKITAKVRHHSRVTFLPLSKP